MIAGRILDVVVIHDSRNGSIQVKLTRTAAYRLVTTGPKAPYLTLGYRDAQKRNARVRLYLPPGRGWLAPAECLDTTVRGAPGTVVVMISAKGIEEARRIIEKG